MSDDQAKQAQLAADKERLDSFYTKLEKAIPMLDRDAGDWPAFLQSSYKLFQAINSLEEKVSGVNPYLSFSSILNTATAKVPELARAFAGNYALRASFCQMDDPEQGHRERAYEEVVSLFAAYNKDHKGSEIGFYAILKATDEAGQQRIQEQLHDAMTVNAELFEANEKLLKRAKEQQDEIEALRKERKEREGKGQGSANDNDGQNYRGRGGHAGGGMSSAFGRAANPVPTPHSYAPKFSP